MAVFSLPLRLQLCLPPPRRGPPAALCRPPTRHSVNVLLSTYAHLIDEYEERQSIDANAEIAAARRKVCSHIVRTSSTRGT
jgi:hypothetical protein